MRFRLCLLFVLLLLPVACSRQRQLSSSSATADISIQYSSNGWSAAERAEYYHLPEGSELMPYAVLANVVSVKTGRPFLEHLERFGFVPDAARPNNPHGLPIGMTVVRSRNANLSGMQMVGFTCAACHLGEISYHGKYLRIDGAPSLIDLQAYQVEFANSLDATLRDPKKLLALILAMEREQNGPISSPNEKGATYDAGSLQSAADVPEKSNADSSFHSVPSKIADTTTYSRGASLSFAQRAQADVAILKARLAYVKHGALLVNGTEPGPGRIDAFGAARNLLFSNYATKMQSPVSFPYIWEVPDGTQQKLTGTDAQWIHYDGNTNSILERNIGQALGMGAVFDPKTFESTLRIQNLHRLQVLTLKLTPPKWPTELFGPVDQAKSRVGEQIFVAKCQGCHQNHLYTLAEMGTDPDRANSFGQPVGNISFPNAVAPILSGIKNRAFVEDGIGKTEQAQMDVNPVIWRATGKYLARPLKGIWATAPYLHNGSVPSLYDLLHPEERPVRFSMGTREYDPQKIGYAMTSGGAWTYDTTQPGNNNTGHAGEKFGTTLSEDQKVALLEFLKTF
jgi:hypothetical protein